jgi:hypothetical protein
VVGEIAGGAFPAEQEGQHCAAAGMGDRVKAFLHMRLPVTTPLC